MRVPAESQLQATDRMLEALVLRVERDYHVKDIIRAPGDKPGQGKAVDLRPAAGWLTLLKRAAWTFGEALGRVPEGRKAACLPTVHHRVCWWWTGAGEPTLGLEVSDV